MRWPTIVIWLALAGSAWGQGLAHPMVGRAEDLPQLLGATMRETRQTKELPPSLLRHLSRDGRLRVGEHSPDVFCSYAGLIGSGEAQLLFAAIAPDLILTHVYYLDANCRGFYAVSFYRRGEQGEYALVWSAMTSVAHKNLAVLRAAAAGLKLRGGADSQ